MADKPTITFSRPLQRVLGSFQKQPSAAKDEGGSKIHVSDAVSRLASVYEKFRNIIDYKEEHLLRKNAIHRIIKRRMLTGGTGASVARTLIIELIQAQYLPNDEIAESKVASVSEIIDRYLALSKYAGETLNWPDRDEQHRWLLGLCAVEIEQTLSSYYKDKALAEAMYEVLTEDMVIAGSEKIDQQVKNLQIYLAVQRALLKADETMTAYALFRLHLPDWHTMDATAVQNLGSRFAQIRDEMDAQQYHPLGEFFLRYAKRYTSFFWIIRDVAEEHPSAALHTFAAPEILDEAVRRASGRRYAEARVKLRRSIIRSFIFIFLTKMLLAFILEVPFELYVKGAVDRMTLGINIIFHPMLMFLIASTIRVPSKKNTDKLIQGIHEIAYRNAGRQLLKRAKLPTQRGPLRKSAVAILYWATFVITFGLIGYGLARLGFNAVSGALFMFFLTIVSFFAVRIRISTREFVVLEKHEGPFAFLIDFFTIPVLRVGRWISMRAPKVNIMLFIFDFLIEAPFKSFLAILEELTSFLREKKEEIS